jgi:hypothetical protein
MYKLAKDMGMRVYDTQPTFVYHASGASNTWDLKKRPDIGRWTQEWPLASSIQTACSPVRAKAIVMACALWNCSCQRLSEMTGVNHHLHFWGTTSNVQRKWWLTNVCQTARPSGERCLIITKRHVLGRLSGFVRQLRARIMMGRHNICTLFDTH